MVSIKEELIFYTENEIISTCDKKNNMIIIKDLFLNEKSQEIQAIKTACVLLAVDRGCTEFYISKTQISIKEDGECVKINDYDVLSSEDNGSVYILTYFNIVLKFFCDNSILMNELSIYELIGSVYVNPEEVGLPSLIGHGDKFILLPRYERMIKHNESEEVYEKIAKAIYNLHRIGIIHRDIKFNNIMLDHEDNPIIIDFGLSTWKIATQHRIPQTSIQTIWFRSPEVAFNRNRKFNTTFSMDWWSYGIILASKKKMIHQPMTNSELIISLKKLFENRDIPEGVDKTAGLFLHKNPLKRYTGEQLLNLPKINSNTFLNILPIANNIFEFKICKLHEFVNSWIEYFTAIDYLYYLKNEEHAAILANTVVGGCSFYENASEYFDLVQGNLLRLNTFNILAMKYPIETILFPCYVLSLNGVAFDHLEQAIWIENYFIQNKKNTNLKILKHYLNNLSHSESFTSINFS